MSSASVIENLQGGTSGSSQSKTNKVAEDKEMFLKLLMAQYQNQDPLNPAEDKEAITQMAQFTSVEQLMNINSSMEDVSETIVKQRISTATGLIGRSVYAKGSDIYVWHDPDGKEDSVISSLNATIPSELSSLTMNVNKLDGDGNSLGIVWSKNLGAFSAGNLNVKDYFDGKDTSGNKLSNGKYTVSFSALDTNGKKVLIETKSAGLVLGLTTKEDGNHLLTLDGGRQVALDNIEMVEAYLGTSGSDETEETDETEEEKKKKEEQSGTTTE